MTTPPLIGPYGSTALKYIDNFESYGANACWFHGFNETAFEACRRTNITACVEFKTFRADFEARPELIPTGVDGKPIRYGRLVQGVCLSQTDFLEETEANLLAGLKSYQPTGIWLDYLTYSGWFEMPEPDLQESCFCPDCIAEFCEATNIDATIPAEILQWHSTRWTQHKCERIAHFACHYANLIRHHLPGCIVGAYMCPWLPDEFDGALRRIFAQDYDLLAPAIDIFTPLIYVQKSGRTATWGRHFLEQSTNLIPENCQVQLILDALDFPASLTETIQASVPSWGIQMFNGAEVFTDAEKADVFKQAVAAIKTRWT